MAITNGYCSLAEVKAALKIIDTIDDATLEMAVEAASREIDGYTNRYFYNAGTATKYFEAQDNYVTDLEDLQSVTTLATSTEADMVFDTTWDATDFQLEPVNGRSGGIVTPYTSVRAIGRYIFPIWNHMTLVKVVGVWGWASVPIAVKQACIIQASRIFKRLDSPLGVAGFGDMGVMRVSNRIDPDVAQLLDPYRTLRNFA
jgi:hypothetical protein